MTRGLILIAAIAATSCASNPTTPTLHLLRADAQAAAVGPIEAPVRVGLGAIELAPYLDQTGIVVETAPGQIHVANQHLWAEPLQAGLRAALRASLSRAIGIEVPTHPTLKWENEVQVSIDRFHATMTGSAVLDARYRILPGADGSAASEYRFSRSTPLSTEGYAALVDAEVQLVDELARAIADSLRQIGVLQP